jgi:protein ImuB
VSARVLALWSPDWPVTAAARNAHMPPHRPAAVFVANRVLACSAVARAQGIRRGLRRREAQARCPDLAVLAPDPDRDARAFEPVVLAVEELVPGVEVVRPGLVVLAARGPVGYFGGEPAAAERLVDQVAARTGVECQAGFADGLFAAVLAARRGLAVAPGDTPAFLAPLGVAELDREPDVDRSELVDLLDRLGLRSLGAFARLDAGDVATRFGADAVLCHRLARGLDPRPPVHRRPPEELTVEIELDPPVHRVDAAAFAARGLAERLHRALAGHGLSCTRLGVAARTVAGEELHRVWRCAEPLTPSGTVDRVRWQLDSWLARGHAGAVDRLWLVPEETVTAGALQLGLWGEVGEADARAGRALVRVQALLGPGAVVTAVLTGGRGPGEQVRLVSWGDAREDTAVIDASGPTGAGGPADGSRTPIMEGYRIDPGTVIEASGRGAVDTTAGGPGTSITERPGHHEAVISASGRGAADTAAEGPRLMTTGVGVPEGAEPPAPSTAPPRFAGAGLAGAGPDSIVGRKGRAGPPPRSTARRRVPTRGSTRTGTVREPPPSWPGRLPAPSPAMVPPQPLPAELLDAEGRPVRLVEPDRLSAPPHRLVVDGGAPCTVEGWAGPWPVLQRWWAPDVDESSRVQVVGDDGTAFLLVVRDGRWWVAGIYD